VLNLLFDATIIGLSSRADTRAATLKRMNAAGALDKLLAVAERNAPASAAALHLASQLCTHFDVKSHAMDSGIDSLARLLSTRVESTDKVLECATRLFQACKIAPDAPMVGGLVAPNGDNALVQWLIGALRSKWSDAACAALTELASISGKSVLFLLCSVLYLSLESQVRVWIFCVIWMCSAKSSLRWSAVLTVLTVLRELRINRSRRAYARWPLWCLVPSAAAIR
jgi:hypothetical protein